MNPLLLGPLLTMGESILNRVIPDKAERARAEVELLKMAAEGELRQTIAQLEINAKEAMHPSVWVAGWRPFFGWAGGVGFLWSTIGQPVLTWYGSARGWPAPPEVNLDLLWAVVTGLLGIGGLRTVEKVRRVTK